MPKTPFLSKKISIKRIILAITITIIIIYILFVSLLRLEWRIRNLIEYFNPKESNIEIEE
jgi:hypothetical protein